MLIKFQFEGSAYSENCLLVALVLKNAHDLGSKRNSDTDVEAVAELGVTLGGRRGEVMHKKVFFDAHETKPRELGEQQLAKLGHEVRLGVLFAGAEAVVIQSSEGGEWVALLKKESVARKMLKIWKKYFVVVHKTTHAHLVAQAAPHARIETVGKAHTPKIVIDFTV